MKTRPASHRSLLLLTTLALCAAFLLPSRRADGYVEVPYALGRLTLESTNIVLMRVEQVDKAKNTIVYRKIRDVKGTHPTEIIKHSIGTAGFHPREWQNIMAWAESGKTALFFHNGSAGECCIDNYWYQIYPGEWWNMSHGEPYLLRSFAGKPEKLATFVEQMIKGQEVMVPCMMDGDKNAIQLRTARLQRMKASLKIQDYDQKRDFAGWGVEEFRAVQGMPGFTHIAPLARTDPGAIGVAVQDIDNDGKPDFAMFGAMKVAVLQNGGGSMNEIRLGTEGGARSVAWADHNLDGLPDLLLATPTGPKLFTNLGKGAFRDDSAGLVSQPYFNTTACGWVDVDGDGRPEIILADGFQGLRCWRNIGAKVPPPLELSSGKWMQCGPFDNKNGLEGFDVPYPPEKGIDLKAEYPGKNGQKATWKDGPIQDGQMTSVKIYREEDHANMAVYLYREFNTNRAVQVPISLGSGGPLAVWLNGEKIVSEKVARQPAPDQSKTVLKLKPGKNELLIKACFAASGRSFYYAATPIAAKDAVPQLFEDISDKAGLGTGGIAGNLKGDGLIVADLSGDGRADLLYLAGTGVVALGTPNGFVEVKDSGLNFKTGRITPVFGDFDGDKKPDLFVPQNGSCKLYRNLGNGKFQDVTASAGDLAKFNGDATSAAWVDFEGKGKPGLLIGCLKSANRYYRNNGNGTFTDATEALGLYQKIFNTRAVAVFDFNGDGAPDVIFNNEGQECCLLLGKPNAFADGR